MKLLLLLLLVSCSTSQSDNEYYALDFSTKTLDCAMQITHPSNNVAIKQTALSLGFTNRHQVRIMLESMIHRCVVKEYSK